MTSLRFQSRFQFRLLIASAAAAAALFAGPAQADANEDFFQAIRQDNPGPVTRLSKQGFDVNALNEKGQTGLYVAIQGESLRAAEAIVEAPSLDPNVVNANGETALMMAALKGNTALAARLIERGAAVNKSGWTPLHYAASGPEVAVAKLLLDKGALVDAESPNRSTPLMMAASYGPEPIVDLLLARGADPKRVNDLKLNAAEFAKRAGREKLATRLQAAANR